MDSPRRPRIVWVSLGAGQGAGPVGPVGPANQGERAASLAALLAGPKADGLVLEGAPEAVGPALQQLRRHPDYALSLIYVSGSPTHGPTPWSRPWVMARPPGAGQAWGSAHEGQRRHQPRWAPSQRGPAGRR